MTFSNAMLYDPPGNYVYNFAKELNDVFNRRWKLLEMKLKCTGGNIQQLHNLDEIEKIGQDKTPEIEKKGQNAPESCLNRASENICLVKGRPISLEEKRYLREELVKLSSELISYFCCLYAPSVLLPTNLDRISSCFRFFFGKII